MPGPSVPGEAARQAARHPSCLEKAPDGPAPSTGHPSAKGISEPARGVETLGVPVGPQQATHKSPRASCYEHLTGLNEATGFACAPLQSWKGVGGQGSGRAGRRSPVGLQSWGAHRLFIQTLKDLRWVSEAFWLCLEAPRGQSVEGTGKMGVPRLPGTPAPGPLHGSPCLQRPLPPGCLSGH